MRRLVLILVLFLGLPAALGAQTQQGSWSNLNRLKDGQGIEVIESSMKRHVGTFVTVTDGLLTLKEKGSDVSVRREDIARVSTSSGPKRGGHALIGLVVGGGIGAGIGAPPSARLAGTWRPSWCHDWCCKRGSRRRRAPRPHNRLPRRPRCRLTLDDIGDADN